MATSERSWNGRQGQFQRACAWRFKREAVRLRRLLLLRLLGCAPDLGYLLPGLGNRALARLARPAWHGCSGPLGRELRRDGFVKLARRFDPLAIAAIRREFETGLADPAATRDLVRQHSDGTAHLARRNLCAARQRLPSLSLLFDEALADELADYFRSDFYVAMVEAYRTYGLPAEAKGAFGKFMTWHLDTQQQIDVVKLFVPLDSVEADQGPTEVLDKPSSIALSLRLARRLDHVHDAEIEGEILKQGRARAMTAAPGDAYLVETQHCFHRAGIPSADRTRDLLVVRIRPWSRLVAPRALAKGRVGQSGAGWAKAGG